MDRYCPECNSNMTPSLVGHLCPDCGHVQRFYSDAGVITASAPTKEENISVTADEEPTTRSAYNHFDDTNQEERRKIRTTLKRLMVPELPPPHHEQLLGKAHERSADLATPEPEDKMGAESKLGNTVPDSEPEAGLGLAFNDSSYTDQNDPGKQAKADSKNKSHAGILIAAVALTLALIGLGVLAYLFIR